MAVKKIQSLVAVLQQGGVAIIPTDTIYGIVGLAFRKSTVLRIRRLRKRNRKKPLVVLIPSLDALTRFGIRLGVVKKPVMRFLKKTWPGRISVALPVPGKKFDYLHRGTGFIAFRVPQKKQLRELLKKTGPLVAPSANLEGKLPATTIREAKKYFGTQVDWYEDGGKVERKASTLVKIINGTPVMIRR